VSCWKEGREGGRERGREGGREGGRVEMVSYKRVDKTGGREGGREGGEGRGRTVRSARSSWRRVARRGRRGEAKTCFHRPGGAERERRKRPMPAARERKEGRRAGGREGEKERGWEKEGRAN